MDRFTLPAQLVEQVLEHARSSPHSEVCGLLAARDGRPSRCIAIRNIAEQPQTLFRMDPKQQIAAFRSMREQGEQLFAIYHSHPNGPTEPSATDIEQAAYPEALYLIVSLNGAAPPVLRGYRIRNGSVQSVQLVTQAAADDNR